MLLDRFGRESSENREGEGLQNLTVTVDVLSPQMLDMLAEKLPQLERLKINFADLRSNDGADVPAWMGEGRRASDMGHEVRPHVF
jgi:hypothetical protein